MALLPFISNRHGSVPEQSPIQPAKERSACATGVKVTSVPLSSLTLQDLFVSPHTRPGGVLVIDPKVFFLIVMVYFGSFLKTACTVIFRVGLRVQILPSGTWQPIHLMNS